MRLVIGSGVGGLRAGLELAKFGDVLVVTKSVVSESNTFYAQGGIATVLDDRDSFAAHIADTVAAGCGLGSMAAIETVVKEAPARIQELIEWGANFDREIDGELSLTARVGIRRRGLCMHWGMRRGGSWRIAWRRRHGGRRRLRYWKIRLCWTC